MNLKVYRYETVNDGLVVYSQAFDSLNDIKSMINAQVDSICEVYVEQEDIIIVEPRHGGTLVYDMTMGYYYVSPTDYYNLRLNYDNLLFRNWLRDDVDLKAIGVSSRVPIYKPTPSWIGFTSIEDVLETIDTSDFSYTTAEWVPPFNEIVYHIVDSGGFKANLILERKLHSGEIYYNRVALSLEVFEKFKTLNRYKPSKTKTNKPILIGEDL